MNSSKDAHVSSFNNLITPQDGCPIIAREGRLLVPDNPVVCYIDGDGIGGEISPVTRKLIDTAVQKIWNGRKRISWLKLCAGREALPLYKELLPTSTLEAIRSRIEIGNIMRLALITGLLASFIHRTIDMRDPRAYFSRCPTAFSAELTSLPSHLDAKN